MAPSTTTSRTFENLGEVSRAVRLSGYSTGDKCNRSNFARITCAGLVKSVSTAADAEVLATAWRSNFYVFNEPETFVASAKNAHLKVSLCADLEGIVALKNQEAALLAQLEVVREQREKAVADAVWQMKNW